jgi:hypothetical protein
MFCERCDPLIRRLAYNPAARPYAELMSGSCIWGDEISHGWCIRCMQGTRWLFHARYCMTVGEPIAPEALSLWDQAEGGFPNWPLLLPERRSPEIAVEVKRLVDEMIERELGPIEAMMNAEQAGLPNPSLQRALAATRGFRQFRRFLGGQVR